MQQLLNVGKDLKDNYLKNPGNQVMVTITGATCTYGIFLGIKGMAACAVSVRFVALGFAKSSVQYFISKAIDKTSWSTTTKAQLKIILYQVPEAFAIFRGIPNSGIEAVNKLPSIYSLTNSNSGTLFYNASGKIEGATFNLPIQGTNEIFNITLVQKQ